MYMYITIYDPIRPPVPPMSWVPQGYPSLSYAATKTIYILRTTTTSVASYIYIHTLYRYSKYTPFTYSPPPTHRGLGGDHHLYFDRPGGDWPVG